MELVVLLPKGVATEALKLSLAIVSILSSDCKMVLGDVQCRLGISTIMAAAVTSTQALKISLQNVPFTSSSVLADWLRYTRTMFTGERR